MSYNKTIPEMNIIMNMTFEQFTIALENFILPRFIIKENYKNPDLNMPLNLFRDVNDSHANYNEWAYNRRDRLAFMTQEELYESSPYSASWIDRNLQRKQSCEENRFFKMMGFEEMLKESSQREVDWYMEDGHKMYDIEDGLGKFQKLKIE